ncbi:MAG: hypothetical protein U0470_08280 [Anaerolineae bacterium]
MRGRPRRRTGRRRVPGRGAGWLPQLYSLPGGNGDADGADGRRGDPPAGAHLPDAILAAYLELLTTARVRGVRIVAVSKTSREAAAHCKLWLEEDRPSGRHGAAAVAVPDELTDSAMIHRFTDDRAGVSTPVVLGTRAFVGGSRAILERPEVAGSPAIVSFFTRLADLDDALRIDMPSRTSAASTRRWPTWAARRRAERSSRTASGRSHRRWTSCARTTAGWPSTTRCCTPSTARSG